MEKIYYLKIDINIYILTINYYVKVITEYVNKAYNKIKSSTDDKLVNDFLDESDRLNKSYRSLKRQNNQFISYWRDLV